MYDLRIDGDVVVYRAGYAADSRGGDVSHSLYNAKLIIKAIEDRFLPCKVTIYLSNHEKKVNFRHSLDPTYKSNRNPASKPKYYNELREYLIKKYGAIEVDWGEADDALCINCTSDTVIASIDKDLLMVPAKHYRIMRDELVDACDPGALALFCREFNGTKSYYVEGFGFKWFCAQMLMGDKIDNIKPPTTRLGPKKIFALLKTATTIPEMWDRIVDFYYKANKPDLLELNSQLLWIAREPCQQFSSQIIDTLHEKDLASRPILSK